jgi:hypothetical protein
MELLTAQHRAFAVKMFFKNGDSATQTQQHFNVGHRVKVPSQNTILLWVLNFRSTGSALKKKPPGSVRTVRTPQNIEAIMQAVINSPCRSASKHVAALRISDCSVGRILHLDFCFHPYKLMVMQELNERDWAKHKTLAKNILEMLTDDMVIVMSDEAHFHLSGYVNKQNFRYWSDKIPRQLHDRPLHCECVTGAVWG